MPRIEITPELEALLARAAGERGCSPADLIASLLDSSGETLRASPLAAFTLAPEFRAKTSDADRYLAILAWIAHHHPSDFADFIEHQESGRRYLGLSPDEIRETCRHNQARQIPGTHYWAIMNLDTPTKRRFLRRLLVFVGETDAVITHVSSTFGRGR
jgi:hypothetical protein